jgi:hypothetical protein
MTYRDELHDSYSDTFKDAHGFRPRHDISHMSDADLEAEIAGLNTYGWQDELSRVAGEAGAEISWEAIGRMSVPEIAHRVGELQKRKRTPTAGEGWALSRE